jgi:hypothetical protein
VVCHRAGGINSASRLRNDVARRLGSEFSIHHRLALIAQALETLAQRFGFLASVHQRQCSPLNLLLEHG